MIKGNMEGLYIGGTLKRSMFSKRYLSISLCFLMALVCVYPAVAKAQPKYNLYFGNLHAHTSYSDGKGTPDTAFEHMKNSHDGDFGAITDHSDITPKHFANLKAAADKYTDSKFVAIAGVEMYIGLGREMCVYNIDDYLSYYKHFPLLKRQLPTFYDWLVAHPNSVATWVHPRDNCRDFEDYAYRTDTRNEHICLLEYSNKDRHHAWFDSYVKALDKGWHIAPAAVGDEHSEIWLTGYEQRTVVLAPSLTRDNILDAIRHARVYATEDKNLRMSYMINDNVMGSVLKNPTVLDFSITLSDPDSNDKIQKVEVFTNGGTIVNSKVFNSNEATWEFQLPPKYKYYFIKITENNDKTAVSAPIWVQS